MTMQFSNLAVRDVADGRVSPEEIEVLRQLGWEQGRMSPDDAETLFATNETLTEANPEWHCFFVAALSNFIVNTVDPAGSVDQEMADELVSRIDRDGRVATLAELDLLVRVLELSKSHPESLRAYALRQIAAAVEQGDGPTRQSGSAETGINASEVALLERVLFGCQSKGVERLGPKEAKLLFQIKDACLHEANAPEWQALFVRGAADFLLGFAGPDALDETRAAELETFMQAEGAAIGSFLARRLTADAEDAFGSLLGGAASSVDGDDAESPELCDHLDADEELDDLEKALIKFIGAETGGASTGAAEECPPYGQGNSAPIIATAHAQGNLTGQLGQGSQLALCGVAPWAAQRG